MDVYPNRIRLLALWAALSGALLLGLVPASHGQDQAVVDSLRGELDASSGPERVELLKELGIQHTRSDLATALGYFEEALALAQRLDLESEVPKLLINAGNVHYSQGGGEQALRHYLRAIERLDEREDASLLAYALNNIGNVYFAQSDFENAVAHYSRALALSERTGDAAAAASAYNKLAQALLRQGRLDEALRYAERGLASREGGGDRDGVARSLIAIGKIQLEREQYPAAAEAGQAALAHARELGNVPYEAAAHQLLAQAYLLLERLDEAAGHAQANADAAEAYGGLNASANAIQLLAHVYAQQEAFEDAYAAQLRYDAVRDSVLTLERTQALSELRTRYETEQMAQQVEIATLRMERQEAMLLGGGAGLLLLLALAGALYHTARLRKKANVLLSGKNAEIEAQKDDLTTLVQEKDGLLAEREMLMREIHHRVKNNLQVVSSLLSLQGRTLSNPVTRDLVRQLRSRIMAMALIHQKLYQTDGLAAIDVQAYAEDLVGFLFQTYGGAGRVGYELHVEPARLDVGAAIPLGLILSELVSNAFKYAFPDGRPGTVRITFHETPAGAYELCVTDDGVGFPPDVDPATTPSLGLRLVRDLAHQLRGAFAIEVGEAGGTSATIRLPADGTSARPAAPPALMQT